MEGLSEVSETICLYDFQDTEDLAEVSEMMKLFCKKMILVKY